MQSKDLASAKIYFLQDKTVQHNCKTVERCSFGDASANHMLAFR